MAGGDSVVLQKTAKLLVAEKNLENLSKRTSAYRSLARVKSYGSGDGIFTNNDHTMVRLLMVPPSEGCLRSKLNLRRLGHTSLLFKLNR